MKNSIELISRGLSFALVLLLIMMVLVVCANVFLRYVMGISLLWADESSVFGLVAITFLGAVGVANRGEHLRMNLLLEAAPEKLRRLINTLEVAITIAASGFVAWYSFKVLLRFLKSGTRSNMADVPMWLPHGTVLIGLLGICLISIIALAQIILQKKADG